MSKKLVVECDTCGATLEGDFKCGDDKEVAKAMKKEKWITEGEQDFCSKDCKNDFGTPSDDYELEDQE